MTPQEISLSPRAVTHPGVPCTRRRLFTIALALQVLLSPFGFVRAGSQRASRTQTPALQSRSPQSGLANNGTIREARKEVEAAAGIAIQTRAILFPKLVSGATYLARQDSLIEANRDPQFPCTFIFRRFPHSEFVGRYPRRGPSSKVNNQSWDADIRIVQSIYEGGRMLSAARSARLMREQALLVFQSTVRTPYSPLPVPTTMRCVGRNRWKCVSSK